MHEERLRSYRIWKFSTALNGRQRSFLDDFGLIHAVRNQTTVSHLSLGHITVLGGTVLMKAPYTEFCNESRRIIGEKQHSGPRLIKLI
jgi:hypothetical protein